MAPQTLSAGTIPAKDASGVARLMAALDVIEAEGAVETSLAVEEMIVGRRATTAPELLWKVRRVVRAIENDWTAEATLSLVASLEADLAEIATSVAA